MDMIIDKYCIIFTYRCERCGHILTKEKIEMTLCPMCDPTILERSLEKYAKEIKDAQNGKDSSNKT